MVVAADVIVISVSLSSGVPARDVIPLDDFDLVGPSAFSGKKKLLVELQQTNKQAIYDAQRPFQRVSEHP